MAKSTLLRSCRASQLTYHTQAFPGQEPHTPQPLYNTIVGVHSINRVSETTMLYPNKNISIILMVIFQYSLYILGSIFESCYPKPCYNEPCYKEVEVYFLPSLRQQKGKNDNRNDFMSNLHQSYVAELGCNHWTCSQMLPTALLSLAMKTNHLIIFASKHNNAAENLLTLII